MPALHTKTVQSPTAWQRMRLAVSTGATLIGWILTGATGAVLRTIHDKFLDTPSLFDFMTAEQIADVRAGTHAVDCTAAIQAAIDWANTNSKALRAYAGGYLCGQITTYPTTTIIGDGRQRTNFWCKSGTTGKWWSDRANGAQKLCLFGMAFYGQNETDLTHIAEFGDTGEVYGTEGVLRDLWLRDAPNAHALLLNANVGVFCQITTQTTKYGIEVKGASNHGSDLICVDTTETGIILSSGHFHRIEVEAPADGSLPVDLHREAHVNGLTVALATGRNVPHVVNIDAAVGDEWSVTGFQIVGAGTYTAQFNQNGTTWDGVEGANFGALYVRGATTAKGNITAQGTLAVTGAITGASVATTGAMTADTVVTGKTGLVVGTAAASAQILSILKSVQTLDFPSIAAGGQQELTFALTGAVANMPIFVGLPVGGPNAGLIIQARISSNDNVTVRATNITAGAIDPASATYVFTTFTYA